MACPRCALVKARRGTLVKRPVLENRTPTRVDLPPPGRARYVIELPKDAEITVVCADGEELCAGRISMTKYRVWSRKARPPLARPPQGQQPPEDSE